MLKNLYKTNFVKMNFANAACAKFLTPQRYPIENFFVAKGKPCFLSFATTDEKRFFDKNRTATNFQTKRFCPLKGKQNFYLQKLRIYF